MKFFLPILVALISLTANGVDAYNKNPRVCPKNWHRHEIKQGDLCANLAAASGVSLGWFLRKNQGKISSCDNLQIDQCVCVRNPRCHNPYRVKKGDTCYSIAADKGLSVAQLKGINPNIPCNNLQPRWPVCFNI